MPKTSKSVHFFSEVCTLEYPKDPAPEQEETTPDPQEEEETTPDPCLLTTQITRCFNWSKAHWRAYMSAFPSFDWLKKNSSVKELNTPDRLGFTPFYLLILFSEKGHAAAILQLLINAGANPNCKTNRGQTALHLAATLEHSLTLQILLRSRRVTEVEAADKRGWTALHYAAWYTDDATMVNALLRAGIPPQAENKRGQTAAALAEMRGHQAVAQAIENKLRIAAQTEKSTEACHP